MENGMYVRKELKVVTYERGSGEDVFVVIINEADPDYPIVKHGESARALVMSLLDQLDT